MAFFKKAKTNGKSLAFWAQKVHRSRDCVVHQNNFDICLPTFSKIYCFKYCPLRLLTLRAGEVASRDGDDLPLVEPLRGVAPHTRCLDRVGAEPREEPRELAVAVERVAGEVAGFEHQNKNITCIFMGMWVSFENLQRLQLGQPVEGAVLQRLELVVVQGPKMMPKKYFLEGRRGKFLKKLTAG